MSGRAGLLATLVALLAAVLLLASAPALAQQFPALTGRVVDGADVLPADAEARLAARLEALETQSQRQFVVATVPSLEGYDIADYSNRLFRVWRLGEKQRNDGLLLLVAPNERKVRVEVGYGLEGVVTDGLSSLIIQNTILPRFRAGDMPGGIEAGADLLAKQLTLPEDEARNIAAQASSRPREQAPRIDMGTIIFLLFVFFFFILPIMRAMRGGRRYRGTGLGPVILWDAMNRSGGWGGGWSSGGSGGGFGGGFSGGGGSSGGGGASGSW